MSGTNNNNMQWDEFLCCSVDINEDRRKSVLSDTNETVDVNFERKYKTSREFSLHHVPGDGSCFYHAVIEGMRKSAKIWTQIINTSDSPDDPITFCDLIVKWWIKYTSTIEEKITEENINEFLNYKFLRYITSESITNDLFENYKIISGLDDHPETYANIEEMKKAVKTECGLFANDFTTLILNEAFHPFLRIVVVKETSGTNTRSLTYDDKKAKSYLWVLLRSQHYYLMRKTGTYKPNNDSFIEMIEYNDEETLKFVTRDWF